MCIYVNYIFFELIIGPNINDGNNCSMINIVDELPVESTPGVTSSTSLSVVQSRKQQYNQLCWFC